MHISHKVCVGKYRWTIYTFHEGKHLLWINLINWVWLCCIFQYFDSFFSLFFFVCFMFAFLRQKGSADNGVNKVNELSRMTILCCETARLVDSGWLQCCQYICVVEQDDTDFTATDICCRLSRSSLVCNVS